MEIIRNVSLALLGVGISFLFVNQIFLSLNCGLKTVKQMAAENVIAAPQVKARLYINVVVNIILVLLITALVYTFTAGFPSYLIAFIMFSFLVIRKSGQSKHNLIAFLNAYGKYIDKGYIKKFKKEHNLQD